MSTFNMSIGWVIHDCLDCHALFGMPIDVDNQYRDTHKTFYCPYCKGEAYYPQETDEEKYRRLATEKDKCCISAMEEANSLERKVRAYKGVVTKLKSRGRG